MTSLKLAEDTGAFAVGMDFESGFYNPECEPQRADALEGYTKATGLPFVFKAVGSADTARIARDAGAAAIIVTTHGGAHGPSWGHPMEILPEIVDAVGDDVLVLAESGVRRGDDVLKLLAQGAKGVTSGRGLVLGLFAGGPAGVAEMLELWKKNSKNPWSWRVAKIWPRSRGYPDSEVGRKEGAIAVSRPRREGSPTKEGAIAVSRPRRGC